MKKIISILAILAIGFSASAQIGRGTYGTLQQYSSLPGTLYNNSFTLKSADTLKGVDTTYAYFTFTNPYYLLFDLKTVQKADSLTGTVIVQACDDNTNWLSITGNWQSITWLTTLCTTCSGASKAFTVATGTNHAYFDVGKTAFKYWRLRIVGTRSTDTTAVTANCYYSY
jgi:hypothetical protein